MNNNITKQLPILMKGSDH